MAREMINSEYKWLGKIPKNWNLVTHKYVFKYKKGKKVRFLNKRTKSSLPYITMEVYRGESKPNYAIQEDGVIVDPSDICILWDGANAGEVYRPNFKGILSSTSAKLKVTYKKLNQEYLYYYLKAYELTLKDNTIGMGIPHVDGNKFLNDKIPLPSIEEQKAITDYLDSLTIIIDNSIKLSKKSIEELNSYKQSLIIETVTKGLHPDVSMKDSGIVWFGNIPEDWIVTKISRLFEIKAGGDAKPEFYNDEKNDIYKYPVYTNSSDKNEVYAYTSKPIFNENSITVTGRGEIGIAFYRDVKFDAIIRLLVLTPKFDLDMRYFAYFINNVLEFSTGSSAVGQLSTIQISPYPILLPSKKEQKQIADYLDEKTAQIDQLIEDKTKLIEELENYKQSLIYEYVTGKKEV